MQRLWEICRAAIRARDWRQLAVAAALIVSGAGMLLSNALPTKSVERAELVEASVVARTASGAASASPSASPSAPHSASGHISAGSGIIGSAAVLSAPATSEPTKSSDTARALQQALRRAGCYDGAINGQWTRQSKEAMARFVASVNAQLPVEQAEPVLLALIEANPKQNCSERTAQVSSPPSARIAPVPARADAAEDNREAAPVRRPAVGEKKASAVLPPAPPPVHSAEAPPVRTAHATDAARSEPPREALKFTPYALAAAPAMVAPVALAAVPGPANVPAAAASLGANGDDATSREVRAPRSARRAHMAPRRYIVRHRARAPANSFERSVTRNVRALQRSLGMIVYY